MQGSGDHVRDKHESDLVPETWNITIDDSVSEPGPEENLARKLEPAVPPACAVFRAQAEVDVFPAEIVKVEATEEEDRIVQVVLVLDSNLGYCIVLHDSIVVCAAQVLEEALRDGEERHQLDIGIMLGGIRDDVVNIVASLPPA